MWLWYAGSMKLQVGVKAFIQNEAGEYLFLRRAQAMVDETEPHWDIPGGRINSEEGLTEALTREISEETGLTLASEPKLIDAIDIIREKIDLHVVRLVYTVQTTGTPSLSEEHQEISWMSRDEALATNIDPYTRKSLLKV